MGFLVLLELDFVTGVATTQCFFLHPGRRVGEGKGLGAATGTKAGGGTRKKHRAAEGYQGVSRRLPL